VILPGAWTALAFAQHELGPRPITESIHNAGLWAFRFLLLSLAVTPWLRIFGPPRVIVLRRVLGLGALAYALIHLELYLADQAFDLAKVAHELFARIYLTIGLATVLLMLPLGITSTDTMIRRLGSVAWRRLHRLAYPIAILGAVHFFMQSKLDVREPVMMAGAFIWLMGFRLIAARLPSWRATSWPVLLALALVTGALTMLGEALYFHLVNRLPMELVLAANLHTAMGPRPGVVVAAAGVAVALAAGIRGVVRPRRRGRGAIPMMQAAAQSS
jgi:methionine sulfoxide reductase heme-binding subunit